MYAIRNAQQRSTSERAKSSGDRFKSAADSIRKTLSGEYRANQPQGRSRFSANQLRITILQFLKALVRFLAEFTDLTKRFNVCWVTSVNLEAVAASSESEAPRRRKVGTVQPFQRNDALQEDSRNSIMAKFGSEDAGVCENVDPSFEDDGQCQNGTGSSSTPAVSSQHEEDKGTNSSFSGGAQDSSDLEEDPAGVSSPLRERVGSQLSVKSCRSSVDSLGGILRQLSAGEDALEIDENNEFVTALDVFSKMEVTDGGLDDEDEESLDRPEDRFALWLSFCDQKVRIREFFFEKKPRRNSDG